MNPSSSNSPASDPSEKLARRAAGRRLPSAMALIVLLTVTNTSSATPSDDAEHDVAVICGKFLDLATCLEAQEQQEWSRHVAEKRKSAYMRFGRSAGPADDVFESAMEKRKSAYMRFGKRGAGELLAAPVEKKKSAYMRFGKRKSAYMRFGKRDAEATAPVEKRKSAYMRFGKRATESESEGPLLEKRKSAYMRFGRK